MKPETQKLLSGGLNLLTAGDDITSGQAIACENWRTDQLGILRSRKGMTELHDFGGTANVHSIMTVQGLPWRRYYGVGADLWRNVATDPTFAACGWLTGFDGKPLGMVSFQGRAWVMNQAKQVKDDGTAILPWWVAPPTSAPTAVAPFNAPVVALAGSGGGLNGSFEYYCCGLRSGVWSLPSLAQATANLVGDIATINPPGYTPTNPTGDYAGQGFDHWGVFRHDRTQELNGGSPNYTAYCVQWVPLGTAIQDYGYNDITANGYISLGLNLDYSYYVTGITQYAEETNPSPALACPTLENGWVGIVRPAFTDPQITGWNVYRSGGAFPLQPYRVNGTTLPLTQSTYYDFGVTTLIGSDSSAYNTGDDQSDAGIAELGLAMATNHDPPPAARGVAGPYFSELLAFNTAANPNRLFWTNTNEPTFFPGSNSQQDGNWVDVGEQGEAIVAIAVFPRWVAILKERSFWRLVGDPATAGADLERTNAEVGLLGTQAWAIAGAQVFGQAQECIFSFNGDKAPSVSPQIDPILKGDAVLAAESMPSLPIDPAQRTTAAMAYKNGRLYFSYAELGQIGNSHTLVYNATAQTWQSDNRAFSALYYEGQGGDLLGAVGTAVYSIEDGADDAGTAIALTYQTRYEDQGQPENDKRYSDILIEHNTGGRDFEVYAYLQNSATAIDLGTINSTARTQQSFTLQDCEWRNISIRLVATAAGAEAQLFAIILHYIVLERNARTYDTEKVPLPKLSLVNALELDLEILSGQVTYTFFAGLNELVPIAAASYSCQAYASDDGSGGNDPQTFQVVLPDGNVAKWTRLMLNGDNYRCRGARLQFQAIGAELTPGPPQYMLLPVGTDYFLDPMTQNPRVSQGTLVNSFTWDSGKIALNKLSLLNALEIGADIESGVVNATFYYGVTDLGTSLTYTLADPLNVAVFLQQIPDAIEARWIELILQGDNWRFHGARLQLQEIGVEQKIQAPGIISLTGGQGTQGVICNSFTWDSGKIALDKLSLLNGLEMGLEILGGSVAGTLQYGTADLAASIPYTLTDPGQVQVFVEQIPDATQARWVRFTLQGDNWRFHGARLQLQEIGVEQKIQAPSIVPLDGGQGGGEGFFINSWTWDSGKIALDKLSLLNGLEIGADIEAGTLNALFSFGVTALDTTLPYSLTDLGNVQVFLEQITDGAQARWVKLLLQGDNWRFHGARLQLQPIGVDQRTMAPQIQSLSESAQGQSGVFVNARTYDSGKVAFEKVSHLNTLEVELDILGGSVAFTLQYGIFDLAAEVTGTYTGSIHTFTTALNLLEARWYRLMLVGDNFRCHGARLQSRPIGVYLAGVGDSYRSGDLTFDSPRIKLISQMRVDCHPDSTIPGTVYTDAPGTMAQRMTPVLLPTATRGWQRFNLPRDTRGRVFRHDFTAAAACRIYDTLFRVKILGEGEGAWKWIKGPVEPTPDGFIWTVIEL